MKTILDPDNRFWRVFGRLADYFILTMLWMITSVPLLTVGTATIAMYDTVVSCIRNGEEGIFKHYFRAFYMELLRGVLLTVLWGVLAYLLNVGLEIVGQLAEGSTVWMVFCVIYMITLLVPLSVLCWTLALESRFCYKLSQLHRTAFDFIRTYLPQTAAIVGILLVAVIALRYVPYLVMFLPAAVAHLQSGFIEKALAQHTSDEGTEEY